MTAAPRPEALWCPNQRSGRANGWSYPPAVEKKLRELTADRSVLQMFGGRSTWGVRLDIDPTTRPHVVGDAWIPPFACNSFDVVILDPPYAGINQHMKQLLLYSAAFVARQHVYWFHTQWVAPDSILRRERSWLIRVGDSCACRCLIEWRVTRRDKQKPNLAIYPRPGAQIQPLVGRRAGAAVRGAARMNPVCRWGCGRRVSRAGKQCQSCRTRRQWAARALGTRVQMAQTASIAAAKARTARAAKPARSAWSRYV